MAPSSCRGSLPSSAPLRSTIHFFRVLLLFTENLNAWPQGFAALLFSCNPQIISSLVDTVRHLKATCIITGTSSDFPFIKTHKIVPDRKNAKTLLYEQKCRTVFRKNTQQSPSLWFSWLFSSCSDISSTTPCIVFKYFYSLGQPCNYMDWENIYTITLKTILNVLDSQYVAAYKILKKNKNYLCKMWKSLRDYTCYLWNHPKEVLDMRAACFRVWTRRRPAVNSILLLTYGKSPKVRSSFSNQSTSLLMPTFIFLSAEAKICQREIVFASYNRIMEPTDMENVEYFIYFDLHKAFDIAFQDTFKSKQICSRWGYYRSGFITGWKKSHSEQFSMLRCQNRRWFWTRM